VVVLAAPVGKMQTLSQAQVETAAGAATMVVAVVATTTATVKPVMAATGAPVYYGAQVVLTHQLTQAMCKFLAIVRALDEQLNY
jgi:hypothetical protein